MFSLAIFRSCFSDGLSSICRLDTFDNSTFYALFDSNLYLPPIVMSSFYRRSNQILSKLTLPLATWRANFLLNVALAWFHLGEAKRPFDSQLRDRLVKFFFNQYACYPGMTGEEFVRRVIESGLTCYLFFVPSVLPSPIPEFGFPHHILRNYPLIPLSSLRQFLQKLVLNMLCFKHVPVSNRSKFYTSASQVYLSELLDHWNTSDDFAIPYYHVILDTMTAGQSILMMSPPPADQLTTL